MSEPYTCSNCGHQYMLRSRIDGDMWFCPECDDTYFPFEPLPEEAYIIWEEPHPKLTIGYMGDVNGAGCDPDVP